MGFREKHLFVPGRVGRGNLTGRRSEHLNVVVVDNGDPEPKPVGSRFNVQRSMPVDSLALKRRGFRSVEEVADMISLTCKAR